MKKLLLIASMMMSASAFAGYVTGDKIEFQADSAFVSAVFSKSLCLDGDTYRAVINKCTEWQNDGGGDRTCVATAKVEVAQPANSTRQRCAQYNDGDCTKWITVAYNQSPVRTVSYYNSQDDLVKTATVTIPSCQ